MNVRVFPAPLQDRREVLTATSTTGNPNAGRASHPCDANVGANAGSLHSAAKIFQSPRGPLRQREGATSGHRRLRRGAESSLAIGGNGQMTDRHLYPVEVLNRATKIFRVAGHMLGEGRLLLAPGSLTFNVRASTPTKSARERYKAT